MSGSASTPRDPSASDQELDPLLDLSLPEEQELPFITIGTTTALPAAASAAAAAAAAAEDDGDDMKVSVLHMETRAHTSYLDAMLAVGIDGCKQIREILEGVIKGSNAGVAPVYGGGGEVDSDNDMDI